MNLNSRAWCDLVFEGRNKAYGAYVMRRKDSRRHLRAFLVFLIVFALGVGIPILIDNILYNRYQQQEESVMVEQYQLLDAILEENMLPEHKKPAVSIPVPTDAAPTVTPSKEIAEKIKPELLTLVENAPENDPYLEELVQEEKTEQPEKKPDEEEQTPADDQLYTTVEQMPSFPGGEQGLLEYLGKNLRYPFAAKEKNIENTVLCCFFIEKDGSVRQPSVLQPVNPLLDREAVRVLQTLPRWMPARKQGKPVRVKYILPVTFRLK